MVIDCLSDSLTKNAPKTLTPIDSRDLGHDPSDESTLGTEKSDLERLVDGVTEDQVPAPQDAAANRPKQDMQRRRKKCIFFETSIFSPLPIMSRFSRLDWGCRFESPRCTFKN